MIDQIFGTINCYCSTSLWQGNRIPVCVCSEWAICGSHCCAALETIWQSSGISLSMVHADSAAGWGDTLLGYCYRWMSLMCLTCPLSPTVSICVPQRSSTVEEGRQRTQSQHSQWACHWENTPWLKKAQLWLPLHAWCGLMMAHPWPGDENPMKCQEPNGFKWEIDRHELHIGNIIDTMGGLGMSLKVVIWWFLYVSLEHTTQCWWNANNDFRYCLASSLLIQRSAVFPFQGLVNYKTAETH